MCRDYGLCVTISVGCWASGVQWKPSRGPALHTFAARKAVPDCVHDQVLRLRGQVKAGRGAGLIRRWQLKGSLIAATGGSSGLVRQVIRPMILTDLRLGVCKFQFSGCICISFI